MSVLIFILLLLLVWLCMKFTWGILKIGYVLCIGIPLAILFVVIGAILCCTVILFPIGTALMRFAGWLVYPF